MEFQYIAKSSVTYSQSLQLCQLYNANTSVAPHHSCMLRLTNRIGFKLIENVIVIYIAIPNTKLIP